MQRIPEYGATLAKVVRSPFKDFFSHQLSFTSVEAYTYVYDWALRTCGKPIGLPMLHLIKSYEMLKRRKRETYFGFYHGQILLSEKQFVIFTLTFDQENVRKEAV